MRPAILNDLFKSVNSLPGLGPRLGKLVERLAGPHVVSLLFHLPIGRIDRRNRPKIADAPAGEVATLIVTVTALIPPSNPRQPFRVRCADETGTLELTFFHAKRDWLEKRYPIGDQIVISGKVEWFHGMPQMSHPDAVVPFEEKDTLDVVEPVYPMTNGLPAKSLRKAIQSALKGLPDLPEWIEAERIAANGWPAWRDAVRRAHDPVEARDLEPTTPIRRRLAFDELFANQLALILVRRQRESLAGRATIGDGRLRGAVIAALPYQLTGAQIRAMAAIDGDLGSDRRMLRLLQGDVGSGKTIVALLTMLTAVEAGRQAVLMAPTEILARQHAESLAPLAWKAGVELGLLTGRDKGKARERLLGRWASGELPILVGTHAVFQDDVCPRDLAVAVIDEQHRFGVDQRLALSEKGQAVDMLVMTATPIPRTLTLTAYGDMEVSKLDEKPPGRTPIKTVAVSSQRFEEVADAVARKVDQGERVYWVCPLVEESEELSLAAASERHAFLKGLMAARFGDVAGDVVGLVHGRMKGADKDATMEAFADGRLSILVATTVIEVGVNVPEATLMVIEHAERFGLAQLHQLRGRVGRGAAASTCILLYDGNASEVAQRRLRTIRDTEDGFLIAEEDLRLRGAGEILGTRQSGLPSFRLADLEHHQDLLEDARQSAEAFLKADPALSTPRGRAAVTALYLFERDGAVRTLRSG